MNRFLCFLTGGHKYRDSNMTAQTTPDDFNTVTLSNPCIKCGTLSIFQMNVGAVLSKDLAERRRMI